nr:Virginiamycin B lyase [Candidatus Eremiobacteraeota bacterium]
LVLGADGNFYFTDPAANKIGQAVVNGTFSVKEYAIPSANAQPAMATLGPDARVYFTETAAGKVGQFRYF